MVTRGSIHSAEDRYPQRQVWSAAECFVVEGYINRRTNDGRLLEVPGRTMPEGMFDGITAQAFVNRGRWMVKCPLITASGDPCFGALEASREDHRFFCASCHNEAAEGKWVAVEWPEDAEEIERLLGMRPAPLNRNWETWETADDLQRENEEHGVL